LYEENLGIKRESGEISIGFGNRNCRGRNHVSKEKRFLTSARKAKEGSRKQRQRL